MSLSQRIAAIEARLATQSTLTTPHYLSFPGREEINWALVNLLPLPPKIYCGVNPDDWDEEVSDEQTVNYQTA